MRHHVADRFTAVLDANVLYPFLVRDVLLSFAWAGLYRPIWTDRINDEWSRNLIAKKPDRAEKIKETVEVMNEAFPEANIEGYETIIESLALPDPDDRHVLAAAIKGHAGIIVTNNTKHFPAATLDGFDVEVSTADEFIVNTFQLYPMDAVAAIRAMRARYASPALSADELKLRIIAAGLVLLAAELDPHLSSV